MLSGKVDPVTSKSNLTSFSLPNLCNLTASKPTYIIEPLTYIINSSFSEGIVPVEIKTVRIVPRYKAKGVHDFCNYPPISILPLISKIFEKLIHTRLYKFLTKYNILYQYQFGFREHHSTDLALNTLNNFISSAFESKTFQKVFFSISVKLSIPSILIYCYRN